MSKVFFKKHSPSQPIIFSDGTGFRAFEVVNHDIGILATEDPTIIRELEACMAARRGGCEKITPEEFLELQSKKNSSPLKPLWREEWQPRKLPPTASGSSLGQVAVAAGDPPQVQRVAPPADAETSFRPKTTRT